MSPAASLAHLEWQGRKINLIDTPGDSGFQADTIASLRVVEGALVVVSGVMGVEVNTCARLGARRGARALARRLRQHARPRARRLLPHAGRPLQEQLSDRCVAIQLPIGAEHELTGVVDLLHDCAYMDPAGAREGDPVPIPEEMAELAAEYREKLLDAVVVTDDALMESYLAGEQLDPAAVAAALKSAVTTDELYPVACGVATKNLGTHALLDLIVEGVPSPVRKAHDDRHRAAVPRRSSSRRSPTRSPGRINVFRVYGGSVTADSTLVNLRDHAKERLGRADAAARARTTTRPTRSCNGDIGAVAKLKDVQTGDLLVDSEREMETADARFPGAGDELRGHPEDEGRRGQGRAGAAPAARGGSDAPAAPRPADRGAAPLGHEPGARRGRGRRA